MERFKARRSWMFTGVVILLLAGAATPGVLSLLTSNNRPSAEYIFGILMIGIIGTLLIWTLFGIRYEFHEGHLYLQGGPFRSRIRYENVFKVERIESVGPLLSGYRILASRQNAIEIHYRGGLFGGVKIAPDDLEGFLEELVKRCPTAHFEWMHADGTAASENK